MQNSKSAKLKRKFRFTNITSASWKGIDLAAPGGLSTVNQGSRYGKDALCKEAKHAPVLQITGRDYLA